MNKHLLFIIITTMFFSLPLAAEDDDMEESSLLIGIGAMHESGVYQDIGSDTGAIPILLGEYGNFWIRGTTLGYTLFDSESFSFAPVINFEVGGGYDPEDADSGSQLYTGLDSLDTATEAGIAVELELGPLELELMYLTDASSTHKGDIFSLSIGEDIEFMDNRLVIEPSIGVSWVSEEYNQYYYGVTAAQSNAFRNAYTADRGVNYEVAILGKYKIGRKLYMLGMVAFDAYDSEITNSPLVEDDSEVSVALGVGYEFAN